MANKRKSDFLRVCAFFCAKNGRCKMEQTKINKMAVEPIKKLFWKMGLPMIISMVLQALGYAVKPLVTPFLRLVVFAFPVAYLFTLSDNVLNLVWWTFIISEALTCVVSALFLRHAIKRKIEKM